MEKMKGTVIRVNKDKGYLFVRGTDGLSRFTHIRDMVTALDFDTIQEGTHVVFVPKADGTRGNGLRATEVEVS